MNYTDRCPSSEQIRRLALCQLEPGSASQIQSHFDTCELCAQTYATLRNADADTSSDSVVDAPVLDLIPPPVVNVVAPRASIALPEWSFLAQALSPGDLGSLGGYRVLSVIGAGGMGVVFLAEDTKLKRQIALKVIKPDLAARSDVRSRFLREAQAVAAIAHDNVVAIHQVSDDGVPYLVMPLLKGMTLADRLRSDDSFTTQEVLRVGREIAQGLDAAHSLGVIHRDIKPANIWLEAGSNRIKLLDFGLARPPGQSSELTTTGTIAGTPLFMAPEQVDGRPIDGRADLYSLGCVLYRMLTGRPPFAAQTPLAALSAIATQAPTPPHQLTSAVSRELSDLVMELLAKSRDERPLSASLVVEKLKCLEDAAQDPEVAIKPSRRVRRWGDYLAASLAVLALSICLGVIVITIRQKDGTELTFQLPDQIVESITIKQPGKPATNVPIRPTEGDFPSSVFDKRQPLAFPKGTPLEIREAQLVATLGDARLRHWGGVLSASFSPDGSLLATGGIDRMVRVWNTGSGEQVHALSGHDARIHSLAFSPDGTQLVSADGLKKTIVWNVNTGQKDLEWVPPASSLNGVSFDSQGRPLAIGARPEGAVVWDIRTGTRRFLVPQKLAASKKTALSPDGRSLAVVRQSNRDLRVFDTATGALRFTRPARMHMGAAAVFAADSSALLYIPANDGDGEERSLHPAKSVVLCNAMTGDVIRTFESESAATVEVSPDGTLASTGGVHATRVWETATGRELQSFDPLPGMVQAIAIDAKNKSIAIGDHGGTVSLSSLATGGQTLLREGHTSRLTCVSFDHGGNLLATGGLDRKAIVWDLSKLQPKLEVPEAIGPITGVWFSHAEGARDHLLVACDGPELTDKPGQLTLWHAKSNSLIGRWPNIGGRVADANLMRESKKVVSIQHDGTAYTFDLHTRQRKTIRDPDAKITVAAFDPEGEFVVTGSDNGSVLRHRLDSDESATTVMRHADRVTAVSFSRDGRYLVSSSQDGRVQIWDCIKNERVETMAGSNEVTAVEVGSNGDCIACLTDGGGLEVWFRGRTTPMTLFSKSIRYRHQTYSRASPIAFSPEGRYLASANPNGTVFILRVERPHALTR